MLGNLTRLIHLRNSELVKHWESTNDSNTEQVGIQCLCQAGACVSVDVILTSLGNFVNVQNFLYKWKM